MMKGKSNLRQAAQFKVNDDDQIFDDYCFVEIKKWNGKDDQNDFLLYNQFSCVRLF